jgi:hypothetical protein
MISDPYVCRSFVGLFATAVEVEVWLENLEGRGEGSGKWKGSWGENTNVYISYYAMQSLPNSVWCRLSSMLHPRRTAA